MEQNYDRKIDHHRLRPPERWPTSTTPTPWPTRRRRCGTLAKSRHILEELLYVQEHGREEPEFPGLRGLGRPGARRVLTFRTPNHPCFSRGRISPPGTGDFANGGLKVTIAPDYRTNIHRDPDLACAVCSIPFPGFYVSFRGQSLLF